MVGDIGHDRKVGLAGFHFDRLLAFGRLSPHAGKPKQTCDEPFDMVPDHEMATGDRRSFALEGEQREPKPKSGVPVQELGAKHRGLPGAADCARRRH